MKKREANPHDFSFTRYNPDSRNHIATADAVAPYRQYRFSLRGIINFQMDFTVPAVPTLIPEKNPRRFSLPIVVALVLSLAALCVHSAALKRFWYWRYPGIDTAMHLAVGMVLAIIFVQLLSAVGQRSISKRNALAVAFVFLIAVLWEVFEYTTGMAFASSNLAVDTWSDISASFLGAVVALRFL